MSTFRLIIKKYDSESKLHYLQINFEEYDGNSCDVKYGDWCEGIPSVDTIKANNSPKVKVKVISDDEDDIIDLDSCAREIRELSNSVKVKTISAKAADTIKCNNFRETPQRHPHKLKIKKITIPNPEYLLDQNITCSDNIISSTTPTMTTQNYDNVQLYEVNPLEQSIEKVKQNNARIMKNIHMLNKTLYYTKKRESDELSCFKPMKSYPCKVCRKCFVYETGLKRHYSMRHSMIDVHPRWQIVWTCIECFQVWPKRDIAERHAAKCCKSQIEDRVREIKTSSLLQCEYCEKVFTSIPQLLSHSKTHTTFNNYECNECKLAFKSYKIVDQHWLVCPWQKVSYHFALPKLFLCNTCDRKFRTYEQLYNHRYKAEHFMPKTFDNPQKTFSMNVYQCEICAKCLLSVSAMSDHKMNHHEVNMSCQI